MSPTAEDKPTPRDAGASMLGVYGLRNPMIVWLLNKRPDLLAETPGEWSAPGWAGERPDCDELITLDAQDICNGVVAELLAECGQPMHFRYVDGKPAWVCFVHTGDDARPFYFRHIERPAPKLATTPDFDLWAEIRRAIDGQGRDLVFTEGRWKLVNA